MAPPATIYGTTPMPTTINSPPAFAGRDEPTDDTFTTAFDQPGDASEFALAYITRDARLQIRVAGFNAGTVERYRTVVRLEE